MSRVINISLKNDFIRCLVDFVEEEYLEKGRDLSEAAFVFEGKRPALFLKRELSRKLGRSFFPPRMFSIDEFIEYSLNKTVSFSRMPNMESWHLLYRISRETAPGIVKGRESFSSFMQWAREMAEFIEMLDLENVGPDELANIEAAAGIGYEIPDNINVMLKNITAVRKAYHEAMREKMTYSQGYIYYRAAQKIREADFPEFNDILFCGFFYMQRTEHEIIKDLYERKKAVLFFQGDEDDWTVLKDNAKSFAGVIKPAAGAEGFDGRDFSSRLELYSAFDTHSQVCAVREILRTVPDPESTLVLLPNPENMIPLVSELGNSVGEFNVSLGYPLKRSSLYFLFEHIIRAQKTKKNGSYYAEDYIAALSNPLVKNLKIMPEYGVSRVLVHKLEEVLLGIEKAPVSGRCFFELDEIENEGKIFEIVCDTLRGMEIPVTPQDVRTVLEKLHKIVFRVWEDISSFYEFAASLGIFLDELINRGSIDKYPLNSKISGRLYSLKDDFENMSFSREEFSRDDIFKIFRNLLENEMARFSGSPLKGLQVLGLLETRALNFRNVIIMDANETELPKPRARENLIPYELLSGLGLNMPEKEEQIQKYLFYRIIASAEKVSVVYEEGTGKEKSRFIEELIWNMQRSRKTLAVFENKKARFNVNMRMPDMRVEKTDAIVSMLKEFPYSVSGINTYLECPLRFYYQYVLRLEEKERLPDDIEAAEIGTFIHELLEEAFTVFVNRKPLIDSDFRESFLKRFSVKFRDTFTDKMRSGAFLLENVVRIRLENFLAFERDSPERDVKEILYLEKKFTEKLSLPGGCYNFRYVVDRVDRMGSGAVFILDYKTG
ncbi:MAG: PD-(D/E)XK nuclease family protein, partial [Candidatus Omnitrophota bacterium]